MSMRIDNGCQGEAALSNVGVTGGHAADAAPIGSDSTAASPGSQLSGVWRVVESPADGLGT